MNHQFQNYATQTAFSISMSKSAIEELHMLCAYCKGETSYGMPIVSKTTEGYLVRRGLIQRPIDKTCQMNWIPTAAGRLLSELLEEAGFANRHLRNAVLN